MAKASGSINSLNDVAVRDIADSLIRRECLSFDLAFKRENVARKPEQCDLLAGFFDRSVLALEVAAESREFMSSAAAIAVAIETSLRATAKLIIAGNGGSAADAQHLWRRNFFRDFWPNDDPCRRLP